MCETARQFALTVRKDAEMEFFDVVDIRTGEPTGETVERSVAHRDGIPHRTAHVWISRIKNGRVQILLQKRCMEKDSFPGCYDISSAGHIPAGVDFIPSALRELKEELGVEASAEELIFCGPRYIEFDSVFHGKEFHDRQYTRVYLLHLDMEESEFTPQPEEIESVMWIDYDECIKRVHENSFKHCLELDEMRMLEGHF